MAKYDFKYVIIGGGMTADAAVHKIRELDAEGSICLLSKEIYPPYARPPLTKALWKGEEELEDIDLETESANIEMHLACSIVRIDSSSKKVVDDNGDEYGYTKLLLATGGTPKKIPKVEGEGIMYYRTKEDFLKLKKLVDENTRFGVIGGGFIGSEIAAAIKIYKPDTEVTMIFPETGICALIFPKELSNYLNEYYRENGIEVLNGDLVENIKRNNNEYIMETKNKRKLTFDVIVAGLGIHPNIDLAKNAGLKVDNGITVNKYLQTSNTDIYAAGDAASYYSPALDKFIRVEHEDNALMMGEIAGANMAGEQTPYEHLSLFYSDLFDLGYEAVGELSSNLEIVEDWFDPNNEGVIYYLEKERVKGVLLWNVWEKAEDAREIIAEKGPFSLKNLKDRIQP
ncbi:MAG: NAD(P)/FAD-dependent oxidoreductase [Candidatus Lokiarchaeota archaeon]|nr:NAD(P)/FAD-dependent oxidoreductase [Candidatus Lokiarchaeota archaeon]